MKEKTFEVLTTEVVSYLKKLSYSESRISQYRSAWERVALFIKDNGLQYYTATVGDAFIYHLIGERSYDTLDRWEKDIIQCANVLTEFLETGSVKYKRNQKIRKLDGPVGQTMLAYITYKKSYGISNNTVENYKRNFQHFLNYLNDVGITGVRFINQQLILNYANQLGFCTPYVRHNNLSTIKIYLK